MEPQKELKRAQLVQSKGTKTQSKGLPKITKREPTGGWNDPTNDSKMAPEWDVGPWPSKYQITFSKHDPKRTSKILKNKKGMTPTPTSYNL